MTDNSQHQLSYSTINEPPPWRFGQVVTAFLLGFVITPLLAALFMGAIFPMLSTTFRVAVTQGASYAMWLFLLWRMREKYGPHLIDYLGLRLEKPWPSYLYDGVLCGTMILLIGWVLGALATVFHWPQQQPYEIFPKDVLRLITVFAVVITPVMEEITFRGFLQPTLYRYMSPTAAILFTAALFTSFHSLYYGNWLALTYVGLMAIVLGIFRYRTHSTLPSILGHLINNGLAAMVMMTSRPIS